MIYCLKTKDKCADANCGNAYWGEFFGTLGATARYVDTDALTSLNAKGSVLFTGEGDAFGKAVGEFAARGGVVIALGSSGLIELCGARKIGDLRPDSDFSVCAHLKFTPQAKSIYGRDCRLPVISDIIHCELINNSAATVLARGEEYDVPLIWVNNVGDGRIYFFAFSLLKTLWYKTQGKPVVRDTDGDGYTRSGDSIIVDRSDDFAIPSADVYMHFIQNILFKETGAPLIHQIPPECGEPCDYIMYFAGDEDLCGEQMYEANRELKSRKIPYYVHLQPKDYKGFTINAEQFRELRSQGLELALHFDFITDKTYGYNRDALKKQVDLYVKCFNELPEVCNTHWIIYNGFGETGRWYKEIGLKGTFRQLNMYTDLTDINKMNDYGFAFGTTYPTQAHDDFKHGNAATGIYELKITFYEPRVDGEEDLKRIDRFMEITDEFALSSNVFIHPVYLVEDKERVLKAVDRILEATRNKRVKFVYANKLVEWWRARAQSELAPAGDGVYKADFKTDLVIKLPQGSNVTVDGKRVDGYSKTIDGTALNLFAVPKGIHKIKVEQK